MGLISKQAFADQAALTVSNLGNYIRRGNVIESPDFPGYIDSDIAENQTWMQKRLVLLAKKGLEKPEKPLESAEIPQKQAEKPAIQQKKSQEPAEKAGKPDKIASKLLGLEEQKKTAEIERIISATKLNHLRIQKQEGELIPFGLLKPIISQLVLSLVSSFKNGGENLITEFCHRHALDAAAQAALRKSLKNIINQAVDEGVDNARMSAERIGEEFLLTKSDTAAA